MFDSVRPYLPLVIPLLILQLVLMVVALVDLAHRQNTRGPRWLWAIIIIVGELLGPVLYFMVGREEA